MDQELISYLERFREEMMGKLEQMDGRIEQIDGRLEQMDGRIERVEVGVRHNGVEIEGVRGELRLVAEAFIGLDEKLSTLRIEMAVEFKKLESLHLRLLVIENRADNATRDVMALVRERLGKPASPEDPL